MGFKKLIQRGTCFDCGIKLLIPSWKWCEIHTPSRWKRKHLKRKFRSSSVRVVESKNLLTLYKVAPGLKGVDLSDKEILVFDETNTIIGYKDRPTIK